jgi:hypothetical protein
MMQEFSLYVDSTGHRCLQVNGKFGIPTTFYIFIELDQLQMFLAVLKQINYDNYSSAAGVWIV